ncbi:hypothetical protein EC973_002556 [Apophysomyces ossiformis]|uniref:Uncharacterized protein n=1 Tax=Apophysomyces ossiformis TaxID=679940 RepID=A0A8H7BYC6_9FUNG|nr:hypothetical protein EC973_002556 [Apophysomyces ossiformis]
MAQLGLGSVESTSRVRSALANIPDIDPKKINNKYLERINEVVVSNNNDTTTPPAVHSNLDMALKQEKVVVQKIDSLEDPFSANSESFQSSEEDDADEGHTFSPLSYSISPKSMTQHNDIFSDDFVQPSMNSSLRFFKQNIPATTAKPNLGYSDDEEDEGMKSHLDLTLAWLDQIYEDEEDQDVENAESSKHQTSLFGAHQEDIGLENRSPRIEEDPPAHVGKKRRYVADNIMRDVEVRFPLRELRLEEWASDKPEAPPKKKVVRWAKPTSPSFPSTSSSSSRTCEPTAIYSPEASSSTRRPVPKVRFLRMLSPKAKPSAKGKEREQP